MRSDGPLTVLLSRNWQVWPCAGLDNTRVPHHGFAAMHPLTLAGLVDPHLKQLLAEHARGNDPLGYFLGKLKASGRKTFVTCRMNDGHNPTAGLGNRASGPTPAGGRR